MSNNFIWFQHCPKKNSCTKTEEGRPLHSLHPQAGGWACLWLESRCPCPWHGCQHHTAHTHLPPGCWPGAKTPSPPSLLLPAAKEKVHSKSTSTHDSKHITQIFLKFVHDQSPYSKSTKTLLFLHTVKPIYFYHYQQVCYHHHPTKLPTPVSFSLKWCANHTNFTRSHLTTRHIRFCKHVLTEILKSIL